MQRIIAMSNISVKTVTPTEASARATTIQIPFKMFMEGIILQFMNGLIKSAKIFNLCTDLLKLMTAN